MTAGERYLLRQLRHGPKMAADFGDANRKVIVSLVNRGLIERRASDPEARQRRLIALTPAGVEALDQLKD